MREKNLQIQIRATEEEKKSVEGAAYKRGKSISEYLMDLHRAAENICPCCGQEVKEKKEK